MNEDIAWTFVTTVEQQHRLRIPTKTASRIDWLLKKAQKKETVLMRIGPHQQLQLVATDQLSQSVESLVERRERETPMSEELAEVMRCYGLRWPLQITSDGEPPRLSITFPQEVRKLGLVAEPLAATVVIAIGPIVEIWKAPELKLYIAAATGRVDRLDESAWERLALL